MKICCVIPAWNETEHIEHSIRQVLDRVDLVIIVDDCSQDDTLKKALKLQSENQEKIAVLHHPINLGQGAALQTGNDYALSQGADIIVHFDADGQFLAEEIPLLIKPLLEEKYDIVFGSRFLDRKSELPASKRKIVMPLARLFNYIFFGLKTTDPQNGFRAMTAASAKKIVIENNLMAHCTEILAKAHRYRLKMKEVPITVIYHNYGQKFSGGFKIIKDLLYKKISG